LQGVVLAKYSLIGSKDRHDSSLVNISTVAKINTLTATLTTSMPKAATKKPSLLGGKGEKNPYMGFTSAKKVHEDNQAIKRFQSKVDDGNELLGVTGGKARTAKQVYNDELKKPLRTTKLYPMTGGYSVKMKKSDPDKYLDTTAVGGYLAQQQRKQAQTLQNRAATMRAKKHPVASSAAYPIGYERGKTWGTELPDNAIGVPTKPKRKVVKRKKRPDPHAPTKRSQADGMMTDAGYSNDGYKIKPKEKKDRPKKRDTSLDGFALADHGYGNSKWDVEI
jgi:hypothetical protein